MEDYGPFVAWPLGLIRRWEEAHPKCEQVKPHGANTKPRRKLRESVSDWIDKFQMLRRQSRRVVAAHQAALPNGDSYDLADSLAYWLMTVRMCYDCLFRVTTWMVEDRDRSQWPNGPNKSYADLATFSKNAPGRNYLHLAMRFSKL